MSEQARIGVKGVIFDLDGVLIDSHEYHRRSWYRLAAEMKVEMSDAFFSETFGQHNNQILPRLLRREVSADELWELSERKESLYREEAQGGIELVKGAEHLLFALRGAGYRLALGSSTPRSNLEFLAVELGLGILMDALVCGDDVSRGKPDPEVFLYAASQIGVAPEHCLVVEDAPAGIEAAAAAGMACIALATTHGAKVLDDCLGARCVLPSLRDLTLPMVRELLEA